MTIRQIPAHLEIYFWTVVIRLISESKFAQHCLRQAYHLRTASPGSLVRLGLALSGAGLLFGIILGLLGI